ncbi:MAG: NAD-dependent epimerase/dehydratase family protein [Chloroflexi bacterium]|nr:NAD-dependent epimerase/dehydratase family protein [Chloroflexota bacterium]
MKIIVTGGAGFIGSHIVDRYIELGHDVLVVDNLATGDTANLNPAARFVEMDVRDPNLADLIEYERPEVINHHAAQTLVRISTERPQFDADVNVLGLINLLEAAKEAGVRKIIFASSGGTVYGLCDRLPITEEQPFAPQSPYGISKVTSEFYLRYYAANWGLKYTSLRYANIFGPRDTVSSEHVITVFATKLLRGERPVIHWDGEQAKDYLYVDDVVEANVLALTQGDNEAYNLGSGKAISVNSIYRSLLNVLGLDIEPRYGPKRLGDVRLFYLDSRKAQRELGWRPHTDFVQGLSQTVAWYRAQLAPSLPLPR